jgi:hypothetical protein
MSPGTACGRRAQAADDIGDFGLLLGEARGDRDRVIAPHDRAEIARGGELVMKASVGHQIGLPMARLAIDDPGQIDPGLSDQIATEFDEEVRISHRIGQSCKALLQRGADTGRIDRRIAGEIGDP